MTIILSPFRFAWCPQQCLLQSLRLGPCSSIACVWRYLLSSITKFVLNFDPYYSDLEAKSPGNPFNLSPPAQTSSGPSLFSRPPPPVLFKPESAASTGAGGVFGMPPPSRPLTEGAALFGKPAPAQTKGGAGLFGKNFSSSGTGTSGLNFPAHTSCFVTH